ncbi:response regulator [Paraburkholderia caballeronis]|uniref:Two-component system, chemotaxis family, response regulator CheY n=1 Tax=Paraburkholderia caballeronis TaxID=416943 RepID=A0A1H7SQ54_9BURK|nr:response regulator [Paraburkholderia caballeronis]PXW22397.1 two-component system chemotaxis response regulator CheY [Paraburkholderia caballeronis]PXW96055.1 two-component system chemotaxis response regulator CheY [Paraburkholderia caballeronis]RAJ92421.1 two-component system chemotaxis response regulator CheY [Paraburkholderia caballeronis]TDV08034.1 two-component system chemotaxis response regulator CheY [Paraburkholderia caballeronis]TDV11902.1 two-component system chemotaxis response r
MITNILVIDDSASMRAILQAALASSGYTVTLAADGDEGLEHALAQRFDLVLTDQYMPHVSGLDLIKQLRANQSYAQTPILVLTTESDETFKAEVRDAGATGWIEKPVDPEMLVDLVGALGDAPG